MSRRNKLQKFAEILEFPNVYENYDTRRPELTGVGGKPADLKGRWAETHFGNAFPITLELACGRGEYSLGLSRLYPERNFIGVDVKGARIWRGAKTALEEGLSNVAFLRARIELIETFFAAQEIQEIWITFPDPFPQNGKVNRRLTSPRFLERYRRLLAPGGLIHLKTDDPGLFVYTAEVVSATPGAKIQLQEDGIYSLNTLPLPELEIKTYYERMHLRAGKAIKYLQFSL